MKWLAAVAAVAALALLAAALLYLFPGDTEAETLVPPPDYTDGLYTQVSAGNGITCGVTYLSNIRCWGRNEAGPLYVPSTLTQTEEPRYAWTDVAVTSGYACGLRSDGVMECWGSQESYFPQIPVNDDGKAGYLPLHLRCSNRLHRHFGGTVQPGLSLRTAAHAERANAEPGAVYGRE